MAGQVLSWHPDDFVQGGLINDVDATFSNCHFGHFTYPGTDITVTAFLADLTDADGNTTEQSWGTGKDNEPSPDGELLMSTGSNTSLKKNSNFHFLMDSMKKAGVNMAPGTGQKISQLSGLKAHIIRVPAPKRTGEKPGEVLIIDPTPGSLKVQPGGKSASAKPAAAAAPTADTAEAKTRELIKASLAKAGGAVKINIVKRDALQALIKEPKLRTPVLDLIGKAEWLDGQIEYGFAVSGDELVTV